MLLEAGQLPGHIVQLYDSDAHLVCSVSRYLRDGLERNDTLIVVATQAHSEYFSRELTSLGYDPDVAVRSGRLTFLDAEETLGKFMVDGQPDADLFLNSVGSTVRALCSRSAGAGLRAYGEMVGVLWTNGEFSAAMALEELWNDLLASCDFSLFCAYPIDIFGPAFHNCDVDALLCSHSHFVPAGADGSLESAIYRAMDELLGPEAAPLRLRIQTDLHPPWAARLKAEALILWLRKNLRDSANDVLNRARQHYKRPARFTARFDATLHA